MSADQTLKTVEFGGLKFLFTDRADSDQRQLAAELRADVVIYIADDHVAVLKDRTGKFGVQHELGRDEVLNAAFAVGVRQADADALTRLAREIREGQQENGR